MYEYKARVTRIISGSIVQMDIDLGFGQVHQAFARLARVNPPHADAPELEDRNRAQAAARALADLIGGQQVTVVSKSVDENGCALVEISLTVGGETFNVNNWMAERGYA